MSWKERKRLTIMVGVKEQELTLVQASELMGVCYRQSKRIWRRYQADGDAGLVHRLRGKPGARRKPPELRAQAQARYAEERYADFGPTLMAEQLLKEKLVVDHETLRRWRLAEGTHPVRRRKQQHRQWRERKPSFGAMVPLDGSHHDWFEGRGPKCVLMVMVDDRDQPAAGAVFRGGNHTGQLRCAGRLGAQARPARQPVCGSGQHLSLRRGGEHCRTTGPKAAPDAVWTGDASAGGGTDPGQQSASQGACGADERHAARPAGQRTAFGRDQRQGKREPVFGREISAPVQPAVCARRRQSVDVHRAVPRHLNEVLSWEEERVVSGDWTVACEGKRYQMDRQHEALSLVRRKVIVRTLRDGRVQLVYQGKLLKWRLLPGGGVRKQAAAKPARKEQRKPGVKPPAMSHPWRRDGVGLGRKYWSGIKASGHAARWGCGPPVGLRYAPASLRPATQPDKQSSQQQPRKGTFSRELTRGHF